MAFYYDKILLQLPLYGSEVLEGQGLGADAGVEARRLDGRDDLIFRQSKAAGDSVGGGLTALAESGTDEGEVAVLVLHLYGGSGADVHPHNGAGDLRGRVEAARRGGEHQF